MTVRENGKQSLPTGEGPAEGSSSVASTAAVSSSPSTPGAASLSSSFSSFSPYLAGPAHPPASATHAAAYFRHNPPQHAPPYHQAAPNGHFLAMQQQPPKTGFPPCQFHPYVHPTLQHHALQQQQQHQQHPGGGWGGANHQLDKIFGAYSSTSSPALLQQTSDGCGVGTPGGVSSHTQHAHAAVHAPQHHHLQQPPHHQHVFAATAVTPVKTSPPRPGDGSAGGFPATSVACSRRSSASSVHKQQFAGTPAGASSVSVDPLLLSASTGLPSEASSLHSGSRRSSLHGMAEERGSSRRSSAHSCASVSTPNKERAAGLGSSRRRPGGAAHQSGVKSEELFGNAPSSQTSPVHTSVGADTTGAETPGASSTGGGGSGSKGDRGGTKDANGNLRGPYAVFTTPLTVPPPPELEGACVRLAEVSESEEQPILCMFQGIG